MKKILLFLIVSTSFIVQRSFARVEKSEIDRAQVARQNHAMIWATFEMNKTCAKILTSDQQTNFAKASEALLSELIGPEMPDQNQISDQAPLFARFWDNLSSIKDPQDEVTSRIRADLAARIYRIQNSFNLDKSKSYSFGQAFRGKTEIMEYLRNFKKVYQKAFDELDVKSEMDRKNRIQNWRLVVDSLGVAVVAGAAGAASIVTGDSLFSAAGMSVMAAILADSIPRTSKGRFWSYKRGEARYQEWIGSQLGAFPIPTAAEFDVEALLNSPSKSPGFYIEVPFAISSTAFAHLRLGGENAFQELFRSCLVQSPKRGCEEHTALMEFFRMNENGLLIGYIKSALDAIQTGQKELLLKGRFATSYYQETQTGEPVFLQWIQFDLDPVDAGTRKPKKQQEEEKAKDWGFEGDLKPVPVRWR